MVSRKNIVVSKDSIGIDKDLTKDQNLNTLIASGERTAPGSRTEKQEIVCIRVIALLAMHPNPMHRSSLFQRDFQTGNRFGWSFFFAVWRRCARSQLHMNSVVLVESQGSCVLVRIVRLQKFDRRDSMIFTVHLNRLIDENTPLEQSTIETFLQEAYKYQKVTKISCDIGSRFEAS